MTRTLVVARYNEPLDWVHRCSDFDEIIVYNKSDETPDLGHGITVRQLPNRGREAHTIVQGILDKYDTVENTDCIVFVQGWPFDHGVHVEDISRATPPSVLGKVLWCDMDGNPHHPKLNLRVAFQKLCDTFRVRFPNKNGYTFCAGAQWCVSGFEIHQWSKETWNSLGDILDGEFKYGNHGHCKIDPWQMERFWPLVFRKSCMNAPTLV